MARFVLWISIGILVVASGAAHGGTPAPGPAQAAPPVGADARQAISYTVGLQIARNLAANPVALDRSALLRGVADGLSGAKPALSEDQIAQALEMYYETVTETRRRALAEPRLERKRLADEAKVASDTFLADNAKREDVVVLDSGLQYRIVKPGEGANPLPTDRVRVRYKTALADGTVLNDAGEDGESEVIDLRRDPRLRGCGEAIVMMKEGAKWQIVVPPDLGYGRQGKGSIGPNAVLVYDIELVEVIK